MDNFLLKVLIGIGLFVSVVGLFVIIGLLTGAITIEIGRRK